ncbi:thiamine-phosphate kinase [bacterium]|nr:thiamine-phosphate kinase [bacterium]
MQENTTIGELGEQGFLDLFRDRFAEHTSGLVLGTGDDVAITPEPESGRRFVWTVDTMVENTHFRFWDDVSPRVIAAKLAASNLSDLASKGARPLYALLSLGVPSATRVSDLERFYDGLDEMLLRFGARLIGGDTVRADSWALTLTLVGDLNTDATVASRDRATPGQNIYVTGCPGESGAGFLVLESDQQGWRERFADLVGRHLSPTPRVGEGQALVAQFDDLAMLDVSDGIVTDSARIVRASGVRLALELERLPISAKLQEFATEAENDALGLFLHGGEDYELLFMTAADESSVRAACGGTPVHRIGRVEAGSGLILCDKNGREHPIEQRGFEHFA